MTKAQEVKAIGCVCVVLGAVAAYQLSTTGFGPGVEPEQEAAEPIRTDPDNWVGEDVGALVATLGEPQAEENDYLLYTRRLGQWDQDQVVVFNIHEGKVQSLDSNLSPSDVEMIVRERQKGPCGPVAER